MRVRRFKRLLALMMTLVMMLPVHSVVGFAGEAEESAAAAQYETVTENSAATWRLADPSNIQVGRNYLIVSEYGALDYLTLVQIPAVSPVNEIPFGMARSPAVNLPPASGSYTLGNYLPGQINIVTNAGNMLADVTWALSAAALPNEIYNPALNTPQTFEVSGVVTLPDGVINPHEISLNVAITVSVDGGKKVDVPWTAVRPTLDSGWEGSTVLEIGEIVRRSALHPAGQPTATATANLLWSDENLYLRISVIDGDIVRGAGHEVDGAEVFLSEDGTRGAQNAFHMNQYRLTSAGMTSFRWSTPTTGLIQSDAWRRVAVETENGYDLFMAIPLLHDYGPVEGKTMLFDIMLNDATAVAAGRTAEISWNDSTWNGFNNSRGWGEITLVRDEPDLRHSILAIADDMGTINPTSLAGRVWVADGANQTFTFEPFSGYVVDTVTVNGRVLEPAEFAGNTYTFNSVTDSDNSINVTFKPDPNAVTIPFIVWNDNFASGEFTTAVIIDLGEGNEVLGSSLNPDMFIVNARNARLTDGAIAFQGTKTITRVYANDEQNVRGYLGAGQNSPDFREGLERGRFIVVEFEFWTLGGGQTTLSGENTTIQNYSIIPTGSINLVGGNAIDLMVFEQTATVNTIIDEFVGYTDYSVRRAMYLHRDDEGNVIEGLPLFVYAPGFTQGGDNPQLDQTASLRGANGAVALMKRMREDDRFASHIMVIAYSAFAFAPPTPANVRIVIEQMIESGAVDPNRIYVSGFSWGGTITHNLINQNPGFFAAAAPLAAVGNYPTAANAANNAELAYWAFVHTGDAPIYQTGVEAFINNAMPLMNNARATRYSSNETFIWPYDQWTPEQMPPHGAQNWSAHDIPAPIFYNPFRVGDIWSIEPTHQSAALGEWEGQYTDIFDWMFSQSIRTYGDLDLVSIPAVSPVDGIPYGRPVAVAAGPNAVWTLGNFLPRQIPIITGAGEVMANVNWVINTTAIPPEMYSPARFVPQTFYVSGTVILPDDIENPNYVSLAVTIQVTVDGGKKVDIPWTAERPNIDGGWDNATTIFVEDYIRRTAAHPGMPADPYAPTATAEADILWGDENLYLRIRVTDDNISTVGANHTVDGAEVFLSEAAFRGAQSGVQAHQMNQYRLSSTGAVSFRWNSTQTAMIGNDEWRRVARKTDFGYELFLAIPLLYNNGPVEGQTMLLDIQLNDATLPAGTRTAEISWNDPSWGGFSNSNGWGEITLVREGDARHSIVATAGHNGSIAPTSLAGRVWVNHGANQTFTVTPAFGYEVDTVTVNGEAATLTNNTFTFTNVTTGDNSIHVTFRRRVDATTLDFIVYNDVFPAGEFTTAVIIDLGEGRTANLADLNPSMFTVAARNTRLDGTTVTFDGTRTISRVYVNTEPAILGYSSPPPGSLDLVTDTPVSGRYIIVELVFWGPTGGYAYGGSTADGSNSTIQNYRINMAAPLPLAGGTALTAVFNQVDVVSPVDQFAISQAGNVQLTVFINENEDLYPLPVFIYIHGGGRGGPAVDRFAAHRTANGGTLLSTPRKQEQFPSHIIVPQGSFIFNGMGGGGETQAHRDNRAALIAYVNEMVAAGLVDPNRIYMSGFSDGGFATMEFVRHHPDFLAAAVPMAGGLRMNEEQIEAAADVAIWPIINRADGGTATGWFDFLNTGLGSTPSWAVRNAGTILQTNLIRDSWPHTGFTWTQHEVEAAVFGQNIGDWDALLAVGDAQAEFADRHIFDWIFAQRRNWDEPELTLTFHLYTANQAILDAFGDYATDVVDGRPVIVVDVEPGTAPTTWAGLEYVLSLGHLYGTADGHGYAFWGWFDDAQLDESGRTGDGLRRPALTLGGESMCVLADLLDQLANATMEEAIALFDDGNIDLYGVWVRFGDVDDSSLVNMADLNLLQRHVNFSHVLPVNFSGAAADVVVDGLVNMTDLSLLQRFTNFGHIITVVLGERPE